MAKPRKPTITKAKPRKLSFAQYRAESLNARRALWNEGMRKLKATMRTGTTGG